MSGPDTTTLIEEVCLGNTSAAQFCACFIKWCHWVDDVIDGDKIWEADDTIRTNLNAAIVFSENEFFQRHRASLIPLIVQSARTFGDSIAWEKREDVQDRRAADVLKAGYHEVVWHVAYLVAQDAGQSGWDHLTLVTKKHRHHNYDCKD